MPDIDEKGTAGVPASAEPRLDRVRFVLVEPHHGGNVGASARALKNLGFGRLDLVTPRCDPVGDEARRMAMDARDLLGRIGIASSLDEALAGATTVIGTSRRRGKHRRPHWRLDRLAPEIARFAAVGEVAVIFGREAHGLSDAELDRCTHLVHFAAAEAYPSFNLAQSVLLVAYQMRLALAESPEDDGGLAPPAEHREREGMYVHLEAALRGSGFLHDQTAEPMMRRIRRMLGRADMTSEEVQILRGVARQMLWLARRAGIEGFEEGESED